MSYTVKDILNLEVAPALGCTEPTAVALCAAAAVSLLPGKEINSIEVWVDPNIYKNGMAVSIPGAGGGSGIDLAAAIGAFGGDPSLKLEVLEPVNDAILKESKEFIKKNNININLLECKQHIFIKVIVKNETNTAEATIEKLHDSITSLKLNGQTMEDSPLLSAQSTEKNYIEKLEEWLTGLSLEELVNLLDNMDEEDLAFIEEGVSVNTKLADYGLRYGPGLGVGMTFVRLVREGLLKKDMILAARILTSAASDARMSGVKLPAMSSAGSGNHGLTAVLPIWAVKDYIVYDDKKSILQAIALSHIITAYIKSHTGRLSALCGCSIAAGAGAAGGVTWLMGGTIQHIASSIKNLISDLAGVICDGAKDSCSLKLATAAGTAVQSALFSLHGINVKATDGIIAFSPEQTMKNVGELSTLGMIDTDRTILRIMLNKQFDIS
ncbi:MAG: serine dehydratase subunit alpha family protein [bacterium]|nr:serine dehydratase subunit alpha family protein [bacterium]